MKGKVQGVTLVDLLIVLAVLAIIMSMASPFTQWVARQQLRSTSHELLLSINYARHLALSTGQPVTLCALHDSGKCRNPWQGSLSVFVDSHRTLALAEATEVRKTVKIPDSIQLQWRGMNPTHSIRFAPTGSMFVSNGTFTISHAALDDVKKIIINRQGRARRE